MKVLVTGATGLVGRQVVNRLRDAGLEVRIASRHPERLGRTSDAVLLPGFDAPADAFLAVMQDVTHVVHCAALNNDRDASEHDYLAVNGALTGQLAGAAATLASGRFLYLSSIRAVVGPGFSGTIDEETLPAPQDAYGRSKREGEIRTLDAYRSAGRSDAAVLRLPPVHGEGMKGNLATLMRLADTALPLPTGALTGIRSLISSDAVAGAVLQLLTKPAALQPIYVAGDRPPATISEIAAAFRRGFGRPPRLLAVPGAPLRAAAKVLGKGKAWDALTASQICDPSLLVSEGWIPQADTLDQLTGLARRRKSAAAHAR
ncbi:NAD-dependent epimerase/dehydratase family protein [Mesorhizobium sp.]|uniref:NAD-dependent epimerase/dehydratase family protein n=2 Tax=Mesorhizobium sp. TaxID=1871066 RepID=UPI000FE800E2|nr:NAD-dependent epimerase/dehydratase family protein [Mesorhizobium sp.]RWA63663.1 MAG: NAD-dependent epimerase/dehydratase family protein [Mesorhizobium sp.]